MNIDNTIQLLITGDSSVGKTSILTRYSNGTFKEDYIATVGIDYFSKDEIINNKTTRIKIWDTAGQERFNSLTQGFFKNVQGVILAYDVTKTESFDNLKNWISSIKTNMQSQKINMPVVIMGNKIDLTDDREIKTEDAEKFAEENQYKYFETSAKTGEGIDDGVRELVNQVLNDANKDNEQENYARDSVQLKKDTGKSDKEKKKGCC